MKWQQSLEEILMGEKQPSRSSDLKGFTLVELIVIVAIVAILTVIAIPQFTKYKLRSYKAELDYDAKSVYIAAQTYLTDNMGATVDTLAELYDGGYNPSPNVVFAGGSISLTAGSISLFSNALKTQQMDNNSVIFANGRMEFVNSP